MWVFTPSLWVCGISGGCGWGRKSCRLSLSSCVTSRIPQWAVGLHPDSHRRTSLCALHRIVDRRGIEPGNFDLPLPHPADDTVMLNEAGEILEGTQTNFGCTVVRACVCAGIRGETWVFSGQVEHSMHSLPCGMYIGCTDPVPFLLSSPVAAANFLSPLPHTPAFPGPGPCRHDCIQAHPVGNRPTDDRTGVPGGRCVQ